MEREQKLKSQGYTNKREMIAEGLYKIFADAPSAIIESIVGAVYVSISRDPNVTSKDVNQQEKITRSKSPSTSLRK